MVTPTDAEQRQALVVLHDLGQLAGRPKAMRVAAIASALAGQRARYEAVAEALEVEANDEAMQRADAMRDAAERIRAVGSTS